MLLHVHLQSSLIRYDHVSVWPCVCMAMCLHGHVSAWPCVCMAMCLHGHVSAWPCVCICMAMCRYGHVSVWASASMDMCMCPYGHVWVRCVCSSPCPMLRHEFQGSPVNSSGHDVDLLAWQCAWASAVLLYTGVGKVGIVSLSLSLLLQRLSPLTPRRTSTPRLPPFWSRHRSS